ncbi:Golgi integral membrane protein 4-like isoform X3 [Amblyraja radiata]|uniref:Golgi integral membrane protein 4-like isoform X3 n=1 Tax=Amblyraja radiata TaxID=386614 RepID=UPI0014037366|nr:Golgi integral membrane protein 4-like isoform X3 [Amblyraja radiata]
MSTMGNGMCSRRQKGLLQTGFCFLVVLCFGLGLYTYTHLKENVRSAETLAQKYKQQQESVSAQLQDFLVYKLEAQESLNKEKQDAMNRYGALSSQHNILKNQHEEMKKQLVGLQLQHNSLQLEHRKAMESHSQQYLQLHQQKELEISSLQDNVLKLRLESKQLRQTHQEMHLQLAKAQGQLEEFRQLKEALNGMPSFKKPGLKPTVQQVQNQAGRRQPWPPANNQANVADQKVEQQLPALADGGQAAGGGGAATGDRPGEPAAGETPGQGERPQHGGSPAWQREEPRAEGANRVPRVARTVNNLPPGNQVQEMLQDNGPERTLGGTAEQEQGQGVAGQHGSMALSGLEVGGALKQVQRWDEIINAVNGDVEYHRESRAENGLGPPVTPARNVRSYWNPGHGNANWSLDRGGDGRERLEEMHQRMGRDLHRWSADIYPMGRLKHTWTDHGLKEAGKMNAEKLFARALSSRREPIPQEPLMPDVDEDPAQDPNNQGEDEFEEAELERPGFAAKVGGVKEQQLLARPAAKNAARKEGANIMDEYQEDQEAENEDNGGEMDDEQEDVDLARKDATEEEAVPGDDEANRDEEY